MNISSTYRLLAMFLAVLMFITSVGLTVDLHYCSGQLKTFSFIGKAKSCHDKSLMACPNHRKMMAQNEHDGIDTGNCCSNKTLHFQFDHLYSLVFFESSFAPVVCFFMPCHRSEPLLGMWVFIYLLLGHGSLLNLVRFTHLQPVCNRICFQIAVSSKTVYSQRMPQGPKSAWEKPMM